MYMILNCRLILSSLSLKRLTNDKAEVKEELKQTDGNPQPKVYKKQDERSFC